jgi:hypothetical protein
MFEVPHSTPRGNPWRLAMLWMGVAVINLISTTFIYPLLFQVFDITSNNYLLISIIVFGSIALLTTFLQWLVLRRFFPGLRWWLPAHVALLILGLLMQNGMIQLAGSLFNSGGGVSASLGAGETVNLFWSLLTGIVGWWLFRPSVRRAWLWPAALVVGTLLRSVPNILVLWPLIERGLSGASTITYAILSVVVSLLASAIQAAVLMQFVRDRQRPAVAATV